MIRYSVRSRQIIDLMSEINRRTLILSPYFQRNLVWRELHKQDFIETILLGYPFPQIFIAKGGIDVENMRSTSCVVDGQQRMNAIRDFVSGDLTVNGKTFQQLPIREREDFLKYEVPVVDLDMRDDDPQIREIFRRLNRTFYSLSTIERLSTEFASSEFMLTAKFMCGEIVITDAGLAEKHENDPNINPSFVRWAQRRDVRAYKDFVLDGKIFTPYETSRMVHLMYTLNLMATFDLGFYNRNEGARSLLEEYAEEYPLRNQMYANFERAAHIYNRMRFTKGSIYLNKATAFSLFHLLSRPENEEINVREIKERLADFADQIPPAYELAAREAVNNKKERELRDGWLCRVTGLGSSSPP